jgi:hypothetical protein
VETQVNAIYSVFGSANRLQKLAGNPPEAGVPQRPSRCDATGTVPGDNLHSWVLGKGAQCTADLGPHVAVSSDQVIAPTDVEIGVVPQDWIERRDLLLAFVDEDSWHGAREEWPDAVQPKKLERTGDDSDRVFVPLDKLSITVFFLTLSGRRGHL